MMGLKAFSAAVMTSLALSGCTSMSIFKDSEPTAPAPNSKLAAPPETRTRAPDLVPETSAPAQNAMSAARIRSIVAGKSFRWTGPNNSGTTLFAQDGNSLLEVDGKGTTSGKWVARDGQLCESINPGPILPKGSPLKCNPFSGSGGRYKVGPATFTPS
jgi:hypothetical protein